MKNIVIFLSVLLAFIAAAQEKAPATQFFIVKGEVTKEVKVTLEDIKGIPPFALPDLEIRNHAGELKGVAKGMQGVPLKDVLMGVALKTTTPKDLSAIYFVLKASDGYINVYSWNELFNASGENKIWVVTEKDGKYLEDMPERILIAHYGDLRSGRRYMKALSEIDVRRAGK